jgi:hypothetical protein
MCEVLATRRAVGFWRLHRILPSARALSKARPMATTFPERSRTWRRVVSVVRSRNGTTRGGAGWSIQRRVAGLTVAGVVASRAASAREIGMA